MKTPYFSRYHHVHNTLRRTSLTILVVSLVSLLSIDSAPANATARASDTMIQSHLPQQARLLAEVDGVGWPPVGVMNISGTGAPAQTLLPIGGVGWPPIGATIITHQRIGSRLLMSLPR